MNPGDGPVFFLGVGGMGMAPLALWLAQAGYEVTGVDDDLQEPVRRLLEEGGVRVRGLMLAEEMGGFVLLVHSSAVTADHPLRAAAASRGIEVLRRGELLARLASSFRLIAVAGSHGKTTTTAMLVAALDACGVDPGYLLGGLFAGCRLPARFRPEGWLVAEIDESDGTIDGFAPEITLLLNSDWDHGDRYPSQGALDAAFEGLLARTSGTALVRADCGLRIGAPRVRRFGAGGAYRLAEASGGGTELVAPDFRARLGLPDPEAFNRDNALAALSVVGEVAGRVRPAVFAGYPGVQRRQAVVFASETVTVVEDYAHHPTEIDALLGWVRRRYPAARVVAVYEAHRFSRTRDLKERLAASLAAADSVHLLPVYGAHEAPVEGGDTGSLLAAFSGAASLLTADRNGLVRLGAETDRGGATVFAMIGAGSIDQFAAAFGAYLADRDDPGAMWRAYLRGRVSPDCLLAVDEPLAPKTTLRVGGPARCYAEPACLSDLRALLRSARLFELPVFCMGRGSNLVVSDAGFPGLVIRFHHARWSEIRSLADGGIWAAAGTRLKQVCVHAAAAGLGGFEFMEGIPASVGGALRMNAGAMGSWIFDVVERVQFLDRDGRYRDLPRDAFHFGYRKVEEISRGVALGALLRSPGAITRREIRGQIDSYAEQRKASQPRQPSAGCIFKNPEAAPAGRLIDELGLKGLRVGGAEVSTVHANFIVNRGGATADDVIRLVKRLRSEVRERAGYLLEPEVLLVGEDWGTVLDDAAAAGVRTDHEPA